MNALSYSCKITVKYSNRITATIPVTEYNPSGICQKLRYYVETFSEDLC